MSLWDIIQHYQIEEARGEARNAVERASRQEARVATINDQIERLLLASQAMWELLRDQLGMTDDQLRAKMREIDGRDGTIDDKMGADVVDCPHCGRKTNTRNGLCNYCQKPVQGAHVFGK
jgi:hypothetical protein